jgi:TRAP-type uncharacterized transport system substrate-binding protein
MKYTFKKLLKISLLFITTMLTHAQAENISIATGGTGGVYYPMGGGLAAVLD